MNEVDMYHIQNGSYDAKILARQLLNSNYGLASADNWAQRYLYITDKLYDTLGIKDYLNKVYGDPMLKFKNGSYIGYDYDLTTNGDLVNQIIKREEEKQTMSNQKQEHIFVIKNICGNRYEITIEKDFSKHDYPYRAIVHYLKDDGEKKLTTSLGYRCWEQVETQLMYDLMNNGFSIHKDFRDVVTQELMRAKHTFAGLFYNNFDSPYQGGYTTGYKNTSDKSKVKPFEVMPKIEKVIFNPPATIVKWKDGTKTIVKCQDDDEFDWEKGLAMAYIKRAFNNERTYYGLFKKNEPNERRFQALYDPMQAKEVRIIVPKDLPVTSDIIMKAYDLIVKECEKKAENGIELDQ